MTPTERRQLIEKRRQGTLTDEEHQQYLALLQEDPSFYDDIKLHNALTCVVREETGREMWEAVQKSRVKPRKRSGVFGSISHYPYAYAMAACVALLIVGLWAFDFFMSTDTTPQLVKSEKRTVYLVTDGPRVGYDDYAGSVWLIWQKNQRQELPQTYTFCKDTLRVFLKNAQDTATWRVVGLRFNPDQQILYLTRPNKPLIPLLECTQEPQGISL